MCFAVSTTWVSLEQPASPISILIILFKQRNWSKHRKICLRKSSGHSEISTWRASASNTWSNITPNISQILCCEDVWEFSQSLSFKSVQCPKPVHYLICADDKPGSSWTTQAVNDLSAGVHTGTALLPSYNYNTANVNFFFIYNLNPIAFATKQSQISDRYSQTHFFHDHPEKSLLSREFLHCTGDHCGACPQIQRLKRLQHHFTEKEAGLCVVKWKISSHSLMG